MEQTAKVENITPKRAMQLLKNNTNNRKLNIRTVNYYAEQILRGEWILTGQGISISEEGNVLDGQHRLNAIIKADKPVRMFVFYDMDGKGFDRYDVGKNRSAGDVFHIAGVKNANNISAMIKHYKQLNLREKQAEYSIKHLGVTRHELLGVYEEGPDFWQEIFKIVSRGWSHLRLYNQGFLGGFLAHAVLDRGFNLKQASLFSAELHGLRPERNQSTFNLRTALIRDAMATQRYTPSVKRSFLTKCWNAYFTGKLVKTYNFKENEKTPHILHIDSIEKLVKLEFDAD